MDLGVIEVVVNTKKNTLLSVIKVVLIILAVCFILLGITMAGVSLVPAIVLLLLGVGAIVGAYFADLNSIVDYEYSLVDRELRIAKILKKERRKFLGTYDLSKLELAGPEGAYQLDTYKNSDRYKVVDVSNHDESDTANRYSMYVDGKTKLVLTIDSDEGKVLIKCVRDFAPSKVVMKG